MPFPPQGQLPLWYPKRPFWTWSLGQAEIDVSATIILLILCPPSTSEMLAMAMCAINERIIPLPFKDETQMVSMCGIL